ncbi:MAG: hypothetical protein OHK005_09800 [Candidatus Methylacidiphilales bacterium]
MEWNIKPRSEVCQETGRPFTEDEVVYTLLLDTAEGLVRQDLCEEAWKAHNENIRPLSFWKSAFKTAPPPEPETVDRTDAESELRRLLESEQEADQKVSFLLAAMLERKRILRVQDRLKVGGVKKVIYVHTGTQETFVVPEPEIKLTELDQLKAELEASTSRIFGRRDGEAGTALTMSSGMG